MAEIPRRRGDGVKVRENRDASDQFQKRLGGRRTSTSGRQSRDAEHEEASVGGEAVQGIPSPVIGSGGFIRLIEWTNRENDDYISHCETNRLVPQSFGHWLG